METVKVVLVDDHDVLRVGIRHMFESLSRYEIVGEAATASAALELIESVRPDIVIMDVAMPDMDGISATREIVRRIPDAKVVVLSAWSGADVEDAINAGATGYVLKSDPPERLARALECVVRSERFI